MGGDFLLFHGLVVEKRVHQQVELCAVLGKQRVRLSQSFGQSQPSLLLDC